MVYGQEPQRDPHHPSFTFTYIVTGVMGSDLSRPKAVTVAAETKEIARTWAGEQLDAWHGSGCWEWRD